MAKTTPQPSRRRAATKFPQSQAPAQQEKCLVGINPVENNLREFSVISAIHLTARNLKTDRMVHCFCLSDSECRRYMELFPSKDWIINTKLEEVPNMLIW